MTESAASKAFAHVNNLTRYVGPPKDEVRADFQECLEIGAFEDPSQSYCLEVKVPDNEISSWLHTKSTYAFAKVVDGKPPLKVLRLLLGALPNTKHVNLPLSKAQFQEQLVLYQLEESFFQDQEHLGPNILFKTPSENGESALNVRLDKFNKAVASFTLRMTFDQATNITCGALNILVFEDLNHVRSRLQALSNYMWHPAFLLVVLTETRTGGKILKLPAHKDAVTKLENAAGVYKNQYYEDSKDPTTLAPSEARDFDPIINGLIPIRTDCDYISFGCKITLEFLDFIEMVATEYDSWPSTADKKPDFWKQCSIACMFKIEYQKTWVSNGLLRCKYITDRAAALANQCYTMIAQKDNYLNLKMAKSIQRDSTDMRSIAVLTLIFLPATFTATFFSTSFYDFSPRDGKIVSGWHWVYWAVTCGLTLTVLIAWFIYTRWGLRIWSSFMKIKATIIKAVKTMAAKNEATKHMGTKKTVSGASADVEKQGLATGVEPRT